MKSTREEQLEQIRALLRGQGRGPAGSSRRPVPPDRLAVRVETLYRLLAGGAGEEPLIEYLRGIEESEPALGEPPGPSEEERLELARDLLRIGVRPRVSRWRQRKVGEQICVICERTVAFCWSCPCGFKICQDCLEENRWGMTCNNITWECPDCGGFRSF